MISISLSRDCKAISGMSRVYYSTHDNGGRPFQVVVKGNHVSVWKNGIRVWYVSAARRVFVGCDHDGGNAGNSVLLKVGENDYVHIGRTVLRFLSRACIHTYMSPIGPNDVPYPYAIDGGGRYYLLIEDVCVENMPVLYESRPYDWFYKRALLTADHGWIPPVQSIADTGIRRFLIAGEQFTLRYQPHPLENYDRCINVFGGPLAVEYSDGTMVHINRDDYIEIMTTFGHNAGFSRLVVNPPAPLMRLCMWREAVYTRGIVMYWLGEAMARSYSPSGAGHLIDIVEFEADFKGEW